MVQKMSLTSEIEFLPYMSSPYQIVKKAKFSILTSRYEGFPMVLTESLHLGTPVISVDCESGPKEIIKNEHNGLLVENYNVKALTEAMDRMVKDEELYLNCKANATASVAHLSKKQIGLQWQSILK
jgi:glycosyltransferase involved in cell wall biosynthesis